MNNCSKRTALRVLRIALVLLLAAGTTVTWAAKKKEEPKKTFALVWPLPPDKPRIQFVGAISGAADVEPPQKQGFLQRLVKIETQQKSRLPFLKPYGITTDSRGRVYVTDTRQADVFVLDRDKQIVTYVGRESQVAFRAPVGLAIDDKDRLWVSDAAGQRVYAFDNDFSPRMVLGNHSEFVAPSGLAVDRERHRLYVVDARKHAVLVFDTDSGKLLKEFGQRGSGNGDLNFPTNVAVDRGGRIYVVDTLNARVQVFGPDYKFLDAWGSRGDRFGQFARPKGIALDSYGNVYVVDATFSNVQIFDPKHRLLMFLGSFGNKPGAFSLPAGIHVDGENSIYVADQNNRRIQIFKLLDGTTEEPQPDRTAKR